MPTKEHLCWRCGKVFNRKLFLQRHLNKKNQCRFLRIDGENDPLAIAVDTDELILNKKVEFDPLPEFDFIKSFEPDQTYSMCIAAIRRSGKTTAIRYFYPYLLQTYDIVLFLSNSIHNQCYNFVTGPRFDNHNPQMFRDLLKFQRRTGNMFRICVIMDDCISKNKKNDDMLLQFFIRGRNSSITIVASTQCTHLVSRNNRNNCDFVMIGNNPSAEFREDVIKAFLSGVVPIPKFIKTKSQKLDYMNQWTLHHTSNKGFVILDNVKGGIYKFRTPMHLLKN